MIYKAGQVLHSKKYWWICILMRFREKDAIWDALFIHPEYSNRPFPGSITLNNLRDLYDV